MAAAQSTNLRSENTRGWPNWAKAARKALLISTALSVGAIGLTASLEKLGYNLQAACNAFTFCAAKAPPPQIPNFNSGFMPGGRTGKDFCIPLAQTWQNKYPDYNIHWTVLPEDTRRKGWGKVEYQYHCAFGATEQTSASQVYMNRFLEFASTNYTATMTALLSVLALAILALRFGPRRVSATTA